MRPNAYAPIELYDSLSAEKPRATLAGFVANLIAGWQSGRADHDSRFALANLDDTILRDIGVETDEISRLRTSEDVLPRRRANAL